MQRANFLGLNGFVWWLGVVENRLDPLKLGRCQVRIFGWHTDNKSDIPTKDLPWAQPMLPTNGESTTSTLKDGQYVVGFFTDGESAQVPIIMGALPGIPDKGPNPSRGFSDQRTTDELKEYPKEPDAIFYTSDGTGVAVNEKEAAQNWPFKLNEPTSSRLYRHEKVDDTNVGMRRKTLDKQVPTAGPEGLYWDEPYPAYNTTPPFNKVTETESGHVFEMDDTPGSERIHMMHRVGTFFEMYPSGTKVEKVTKNNYQIIMGDDMIHVMGRVNITVDSDVNILARGDINIIGGNDLSARIAGNIDITAGENINFRAKNLSMQIDDSIQIQTTTFNESSSNKNLTASNYKETVGESFYRWNGDKHMWTGADTFSRHASGTDHSCPSDPSRDSGEDCSNITSATNSSVPGIPEAPFRSEYNNPVVEEEEIPVPNLKVVSLDSITPEQGEALKSTPEYGASETTNPAERAPATPVTIGDGECIPISNLAVSQNCINLIKEKEGFRAQAYVDPGTKGQPITIGYGVTAQSLGRPIKLGDTVSQQQAEEDLKLVVDNFAVQVKKLLTIDCVTQGQFDALVSFAYNVGAGNLKKSTLLKLTNAGDRIAAGDAFLDWTKAAGKVLPGLVTRRQKERELYLS
jgi:lysozyme